MTVLLTSCLTGLVLSVLQIKTKTVSSHTADSKPVKQKVNSTVTLPPLVFPGIGHRFHGLTAQDTPKKSFKELALDVKDIKTFFLCH